MFSTEELDKLIAKLWSHVTVNDNMDKEDDSPSVIIAGHSTDAYWKFEDDVILVYVCDYWDHTGLELIDKVTGNSVLVVGEKPAYRDDYHYNIQKIDNHGFTQILPHLESIFEKYKFQKDDLVVLPFSKDDTIYRVLGVIESWEGYMWDQFKVVTCAAEPLGKRLYGKQHPRYTLRKVTKEEIESHYNRWKNLAIQFGITP
jgi:hypothetical protein